MLARPEGILVITGPTGSGKTTTLYSLLSQLNVESVNIMTLEDPVEYPVAMMRQTSVNEAAKMDFVNGIRSMMRQDPDIILVGEVRDKDTAEMAFRAAMTGHQVFTTLHTNSALGAFPGYSTSASCLTSLPATSSASSRSAWCACCAPYCKEAMRRPHEERQILGPAAEDTRHIYRAVGCGKCNNKGYKGRSAVMELLVMDSDMDELVARRATARELRTAALARNFKSLAEEGIARVLDGCHQPRRGFTHDRHDRKVDLAACQTVKSDRLPAPTNFQ